MSREEGSGHAYKPTFYVQHDSFKEQGRTATEMGMLWYLQMREDRGMGGATHHQMMKDMKMSPRGLWGTIKKLREEGLIQ
jgi:hypothetical protein